jgi:acetoin:2,6-dichlorophenolindophenol oxidoreductase subunit alpha
VARRSTRTRAGEPARVIDRAAARRLLETMWRIRCFEERIAQLYRTLQVHGLVHLSIGTEGVAAAVCAQLTDADAVYSGHRAHGHALAKGAPLNETMAELMGRDAGLCHGLGGSMHLVDRAHGLMGATGVVGGNLPMAAGDALAAKIEGTGRVAVVFFGDGAVQAGHFHETVNLAALWQLPLLFVCENNGMAEFTTRAEHTVVASVADVVSPYGFPTRQVEGADVPALFEAAAELVALAREGGGPCLMECATHRFRGHYEGDQQAYREALEDSETARLDPIVTLEKLASSKRWVSRAQAREIEGTARDEVEAAVAFGRDSRPPTEAEAAGYVYAEPEAA